MSLGSRKCLAVLPWRRDSQFLTLFDKFWTFHGQTTLMSFERTIQRYTITRLVKVEIRNYL